MAGGIKSFLEVVLFFLATFLLYFLFILAFPIFREPHGFLIMTEFSGISKTLLIKLSLFFSSGLCVLLGALMMNWVPIFAPGVMANLWGTTFFFIWVDPVLTLSEQTQSFSFVTALGIGLVFIYLFFFSLHFLAPQNEKLYQPSFWKARMAGYFLWGWIGFYFGLSALMAAGSFRHPGFRLPLAFGAMILCFLFYLLNLFMKKTEGKEAGTFSKIGRWIFILWFLGLTAVGMGEKWLR